VLGAKTDRPADRSDTIAAQGNIDDFRIGSAAVEDARIADQGVAAGNHELQNT
jgi:hypothetical protein